MTKPMTAQDVRDWIAEISEGHVTHEQIIDLYRAVLRSIAYNPINPSPTRATAEEALTL